ncbi:MAG: hypothetical protein U9N02_04055 [Campylobacterota bacterium]|nr:hypothetical protein [Campylobacterota bacterium]
MKFIIYICLLFNLSFANENSELLRELKILIEQNGKKIEQNGQKIEQNGQKIEQNGQKIEQNSADIKTMQSQVSFIQTLLSIVLGGVIASPFFVIYLQRQNDKYAQKEIKQNSEITTKLLVALKELSEDDPKIQRSLRVAGLI